MDTTKLAQKAQEFRRYKLHILGLFETRWKNSGEKRLSTGETLNFSGKPLNADHSSHARFLTYVQVYAPTEKATLADKDAFYEQLAHTLEQVRNSDIIIVLAT